MQVVGGASSCLLGSWSGCHQGYTLDWLDGELLACGGTASPHRCRSYEVSLAPGPALSDQNRIS